MLIFFPKIYLEKYIISYLKFRLLQYQLGFLECSYLITNIFIGLILLASYHVTNRGQYIGLTNIQVKHHIVSMNSRQMSTCLFLFESKVCCPCMNQGDVTLCTNQQCVFPVSMYNLKFLLVYALFCAQIKSNP